MTRIQSINKVHLRKTICFEEVCDNAKNTTYFHSNNSIIYTSQFHATYGSIMPGRYFSSGTGYAWGFNGQIKDDEIYGSGNAISFEYRVHDARLCRFLSVYPLTKNYPWNSTYAFAENRVIDGIDLEGLEFICAFTFGEEKTWGIAFIKKIDDCTQETNLIQISGAAGRGGISDFRNALIVASSRDNNGIGFLAIFSHGDADDYSSRIFSNSTTNPNADNVYAIDLRTLTSDIKDGKIKFSMGATIYLGACNAGTENPNDHLIFAQELANVTGTKVIAMANSHCGPNDDKDVNNTVFITGDPYNINSGFYEYNKNQSPLFIGNKLDVVKLAKETIERVEYAISKTDEASSPVPGESKMSINCD